MSKHQRQWRVLGLGATALLLSVAACSDDEGDLLGGGGRGGSAGMNTGGSKAGASSTAGSSSTAGKAQGGSAGTTQGGSAGTTQGGSAGTAQGGAAGDGSVTVGGEGGSLGEAGAGLGAAGNGGAPDSVAGAGMAGEGGGGPSSPDGCDYVEANSNQDEATGLTASDALQIICANANNGDYEPVEELVDRDGFEVTVAADTDVLIKLELSDPQALTGAIMFLNGAPTYAVGGRAVARYRSGYDGEVIIAVRTYNDEDVAAPVPYKLSIAADDIAQRCPASAAAATFSEANDGAGNRDNDVYQFSYDYEVSLTDAADAAEPTAITLAAPPQTYRLDGSSADISFLSPYADGDSFAFHTGPNVSQLTVRADWPGDDRDFDIYLFRAGFELQEASGIEESLVSGEYLTVTVEPDTDYVLWAGLYEGTQPSPYSLTLCSEAFSLMGD